MVTFKYAFPLKPCSTFSLFALGSKSMLISVKSDSSVLVFEGENWSHECPWCDTHQIF